jgi:hypothetical protein
LIPELFGTRLRYTGASIAYQLASPIAGGLSPVLAVWLVKTYPDQFWPLAQYVIVISVISLACVQLLAETSRRDLSAPDYPDPNAIHLPIDSRNDRGENLKQTSPGVFDRNLKGG